MPEVVRFDKGVDEKGYENIWHSDVSWREVPSLGSVLRAIEVPAVRRRHAVVRHVRGLRGAPADVRDRIDGLDAVHDFSTSFGALMEPDALAEMQQRYPAVRHPIVRTHPDTGRRLLYVNGIFTTHIPDLDPAESDALLELLFAQARVPEYQCRFHWEAGSLAFWDNRSTQHYACSDYYPSRPGHGAGHHHRHPPVLIGSGPAEDYRGGAAGTRRQTWRALHRRSPSVERISRTHPCWPPWSTW